MEVEKKSKKGYDILLTLSEDEANRLRTFLFFKMNEKYPTAIELYDKLFDLMKKNK